MATPDGTQFQVATDAAFTNKLIDYSGAYKTNHDTAAGVLTKGIPLYSRVRHSSAETGYSSWSATRQFSVTNWVKRIQIFDGIDINSMNSSIINIKEKNNNIYSVGTITISNVSYPWIIKQNNNSSLSTIFQFRLNVSGYIYDALIDDSDNVYITGSILANTHYQAFIMKLNPTGSILWQQLISGTEYLNYGSDGNRLKFDSSGNIVVFGTCIYSINTYAYCIRFSTTGTILLHKQFDTISQGRGLELDADGNTYIAGMIRDASGNNTPFIAKMDTNFNIIWKYGLESTTPYGFGYYGIKLDNLGNIYTVGTWFNGTDQCLFLSKWTTAGTLLYNKYINYNSGGSDTILTDVNIDFNGYIYICGRLYVSTYSASIIFKLEVDGSPIWKRRLNTNSNIPNSKNNISKINFNTLGNLFIGGSIYITDRQKPFICELLPNGDFLGTVNNLSILSWSEDSGVLNINTNARANIVLSLMNGTSSIVNSGMQLVTTNLIPNLINF